uniref:Uncharacterized protein n=1 Tax=Cucumis melo TaxID=3656 RepID=A0A9I9E074_CUCME
MKMKIMIQSIAPIEDKDDARLGYATLNMKMMITSVHYIKDEDDDHI